MSRIPLIALIVLFSFPATRFLSTAVAQDEHAEAEIQFNRDIRPILSDRCFACHGPDRNSKASEETELRLDVRESAVDYGAIEPGDTDASELLARVSSDDPDERMPPVDSHKPRLTQHEIELLRRWIEQGAEYQKLWSLVPPKRSEFPTIKNSEWAKNAIDHFVLARLEREGIQPSSVAVRPTLIRRVTFDLIGLPPTLPEIDAFVNDPAPIGQAYETVVDRLFVSQQYGEHLAAEWLQIARFADSNGYQNDFRRSMWPWRDWVIAAFNQNMPFDQFIVEQMAGDLLPDPTQSQRIATGFHRNNRTVTEGGSIDEEWRVENNVDRVETTAAAFLGLTMGCARCHDHKYDPITQKEFYQFYAFFNSIDEKGFYNETRGNVPPLIKVPRDEDQKQLAEFDAKISAAQDTFRKSLENGDEQAARLAVAKLQEQRKQFEARIPTTMILKDRKTPRPTYLLKRGAYDAPDKSEKLRTDVPAFLQQLPNDEPRNRLGLANWLTDPAHPLVARVQVNRVWQRLFGRGIVKTSDNFGAQGDPPSHPELLDWLAVEFVGSGWDLKAIQKMIVMSATYQQSSDASPATFDRDPQNRLLARGPRFRLPAESLRDNALAISGLLTMKIGGPSVKPYQPAGLWQELAGGAGEGEYVQSKGDDLFRRSLYTNRKRTVPHPTMSTFDAPSFEICQAKRTVTNTPLQALALLNDVTYVEAARGLALRMIREVADSPADRVRHGFRLATARVPNEKELKVLLSSLDRHLKTYESDPVAATKLLKHGEAPLDNTVSPGELAAYTIVAGIILNLDETITHE